MEALSRPPSESSLDRILPAFERALLRECSPKTVRSYRWAILDFFRFVRERGVDDLADVDRALLEDWQDNLRERETRNGNLVQSSSRSIASTAIRRLLKWAAERDIVDWKLERAIVRVTVHSKEPDPLDPEVLAVLVAHYSRLLQEPDTTLIGLRDAALFFAFLTTGLRPFEMLQLTVDNYAAATVIQKGGSEKKPRFPPAVLEIIARYLDARRDRLPWLWIAIGNNVNDIRLLQEPGVRGIFHRVAYLLGIPRFRVYRLRHTYGTEMVEQDVPIEVVAHSLGHKDLRTVLRYVKIRDRRRQLAVDAAARLVPATVSARQPIFRRRRRR